MQAKGFDGGGPKGVTGATDSEGTGGVTGSLVPPADMGSIPTSGASVVPEPIPGDRCLRWLTPWSAFMRLILLPALVGFTVAAFAASLVVFGFVLPFVAAVGGGDGLAIAYLVCWGVVGLWALGRWLLW